MTNKRKKNANDKSSSDNDINTIDVFDLWVLLDNAHFAVSRARILELSQYNLTKEQAQVLYVLLNSGGSATQAQISDFTMRQHHSVSTLVNRMVKDGLVHKEKDPAGKGFLICITRKGRDKYRKVTRESMEMIFSSLSSDEVKQLTRYLEQLQQTARGLLGMDYKPPFLK
ncbi:MAG: MarR family transcriptional regulator [Dehalococcoidia bacterium]|jgi:DNA-binding MarR family transcriptional regulator